MFQNLDLKVISEGPLILKKECMSYFLALEYDFYVDIKGKTNHNFIVLGTDKAISWYFSHDLKDIVNLSGDYNEQRKN